MDFQRWLAKGVPTVNASAEKQLAKRYGLAPQSRAIADNQLTPPAKRNRITLSKDADIAFVDDAISGVQTWVDNGCEGREYGLPTCNSFLRRALHERLDDIDVDFTREMRGEGWGQLFVMVMDAGAKEAYEAKKALLARRNFDRACGFRRVFKLLTECRLPMVGHNCFYDVLFTMASFEGKLPERLIDFKKSLNTFFPIIIDTKFVSEYWSAGQVYPSTALGDLYKALTKEDVNDEAWVITFSESFDERYAPGSNAFHEAGWDAYSTGVCFVRLAQRVLKLQTDVDVCAGPKAISLLADLVGNNVFCMFSPIVWAVDPLRLDGTSAEFRGGSVVVLENLSKEDNLTGVRELFGYDRETCKFCDDVGWQHADLQWDGDNRALVSLIPGKDFPSLTSEHVEGFIDGISHERIVASSWRRFINQKAAEDADAAKLPVARTEKEGETNRGWFEWIVGTIAGSKKRKRQD